MSDDQQSTDTDPSREKWVSDYLITQPAESVEGLICALWDTLDATRDREADARMDVKGLTLELAAELAKTKRAMTALDMTRRQAEYHARMDAESRNELEAMWDAFAKYGRHADGCKLQLPGSCLCGLADALARMTEGGE